MAIGHIATVFIIRYRTTLNLLQTLLVWPQIDSALDMLVCWPQFLEWILCFNIMQYLASRHKFRSVASKTIPSEWIVSIHLFTGYLKSCFYHQMYKLPHPSSFKYKNCRNQLFKATEPHLLNGFGTKNYTATMRKYLPISGSTVCSIQNFYLRYPPIVK